MERRIASARRAELRVAAEGAELERAIRELYATSDDAARRVDRGLFARYVWAGLHEPRG